MIRFGGRGGIALVLGRSVERLLRSRLVDGYPQVGLDVEVDQMACSGEQSLWEDRMWNACSGLTVRFAANTVRVCSVQELVTSSEDVQTLNDRSLCQCFPFLSPSPYLRPEICP